jgi:hypothetical protein
MQARALLHTKMPNQTALCKEVCGELNRATEGSSDHSSLNTTVETTNTLSTVNRLEAMPCARVMVLSTNRPEFREALKTGLYKEEWTASRGTDNSGSCTAEHVDAQILSISIFEEEFGERITHGIIEAQTAAIEEDLIDIGSADTAVNFPKSFVAYNNAHAVDRSSVVVRLVALILKFALQLHANFNCLKRVCRGYSAARRDAASDEGAVVTRSAQERSRNGNFEEQARAFDKSLPNGGRHGPELSKHEEVAVDCESEDI